MTTRRQLLDGIYNDFLAEIQPHIVDLEKVKTAGINTNWLDTLVWINQVTVENAELIINMYGLQDEVIPGHHESALDVVKKFITKVKTL